MKQMQYQASIVALAITIFVGGRGIGNDSFGTVVFINASPYEGVNLMLGDSELGSNYGLPPGDFDGPYTFKKGSYELRLKRTDEMLASGTVDLPAGGEVLIIATGGAAGGTSGGGEPAQLIIVNKSDVAAPGNDPCLFVLSFLPEEKGEFSLGGDLRFWKRGTPVLADQWDQSSMRAEGDGWTAEVEWSRDRAEEEAHQVAILFEGPEERPMMARHVFFSVD